MVQPVLPRSPLRKKKELVLETHITNSQSDLLPDDLIAQSVEDCTGIAEVMGSNPVQA